MEPRHCPKFEPAEWPSVQLVVFDVDGTLYRQRPLRMRIARDILVDALRNRSLGRIRVLRTYRRIREQMGHEGVPDFLEPLLTQTADAEGVSTDVVESIVSEWIQQRPLTYLAACRYPGLPQLFEGLRRNGKTIGILSDYPAREKIRALGLQADVIVSACDPNVGVLKPDPRGLAVAIATAGATADTTVMIGDRIDRDGAAAARLGVRTLIRSARPIDGWQTFRRYDDVVFAPIRADEHRVGTASHR